MELDLLNSRDKKLPLTAHIQNLGFVWKVGHFVFWVTFVKHEAKRFQNPKLRFMREPLCNIFQPIFPKDFLANFGVLKLNWIRGILFLNSFEMFSRKWLFHWRFCSGSKRFSLPRLTSIRGLQLHLFRVQLDLICWLISKFQNGLSSWLWLNWICWFSQKPRTIHVLTHDFALTGFHFADFWFRSIGLFLVHRLNFDSMDFWLTRFRKIGQLIDNSSIAWKSCRNKLD